MLLLLLGTAAPLAADQFELFTYEVAGDTVEITDYPEDAVGAVDIPAEIAGRPVTRIGAKPSRAGPRAVKSAASNVT